MLDQLSPARAEPQQQSRPNNMEKIREMYQMYRTAQNPANMLQQMMMQNPMLSQLAQIQQGGGNMQNAFYTLCQQQGISPETILEQLTD